MTSEKRKIPSEKYWKNKTQRFMIEIYTVIVDRRKCDVQRTSNKNTKNK